MSQQPARGHRTQSPYRATARPDVPDERSDIRVRDLIVLAALALTLASIGQWPQAVDAFATRVMGFPALR